MPEFEKPAPTSGTPESASGEIIHRKIIQVPENLKGIFNLQEKELLEIASPGSQNRMLVYGGSGGGIDFADLRDFLKKECQLEISLNVDFPKEDAGKARLLNGPQSPDQPPPAIPIEEALALFKEKETLERKAASQQETQGKDVWQEASEPKSMIDELEELISSSEKIVGIKPPELLGKEIERKSRIDLLEDQIDSLEEIVGKEFPELLELLGKKIELKPMSKTQIISRIDILDAKRDRMEELLQEKFPGAVVESVLPPRVKDHPSRIDILERDLGDIEKWLKEREQAGEKTVEQSPEKTEQQTPEEIKRFAETAEVRKNLLKSIDDPERKQRMDEIFSKIVFNNDQLTPEDMDLWAEENGYTELGQPGHRVWIDSRNTAIAFTESDTEKNLLSEENLAKFRHIIVELDAAKNGRARTALLVEFIYNPPQNTKDLEVLSDFVDILKQEAPRLRTYLEYIGIRNALDQGTSKEDILEEQRGRSSPQ